MGATVDFLFGLFLIIWLCFPAIALLVWVLAVIRYRVRADPGMGFIGAWASLWRLIWNGEGAPTTTKAKASATTAPAPERQYSKRLEKVRSQVVSFDYVDANGDFTTRKVRVDTVGEWNFEGYCYKRRERRTFRYDGVVGYITVQETGETVEPSDLKTTLLNES